MNTHPTLSTGSALTIADAYRLIKESGTDKIELTSGQLSDLLDEAVSNQLKRTGLFPHKGIDDGPPDPKPKVLYANDPAGILDTSDAIAAHNNVLRTGRLPGQ